MDSRSTELTDLVEWRQWKPQVVQSAPRKSGIYLFRMAQPFPRLKGMSDIVYIGCTTSQRTISDRLKDHLSVREIERNTAYYLERVQCEVNAIEVSWKTFEKPTGAKDAERNLLEKYVADHIELPPLNRQASGQQVRIVSELITRILPNKDFYLSYELVEKLKKAPG